MSDSWRDRGGRGDRSRREERRVGESLSAYLRGQGHEDAYLLGRVCGCWGTVVGEEVAAHATPRLLRAGELVVTVDHPGWVTQLAFLGEQILARLEAELGTPVARTLKATVRGRPGVE